MIIKKYKFELKIKFEGNLLNGKLNGKIKEFIAEKAKLEEENKKVQLKLEKERVRKENELAEKKRKEEDTEKERQKISS